MRVKLRLPEGWICAKDEQGIYLSAHRRNGDILTFDVIAPETIGCFETIELEILRNGMLCPEIISLPMHLRLSHDEVAEICRRIADFCGGTK